MLMRLSKADVLGQLASVRRMAAKAGEEVRDWKVRVPRNCEPPAMDVVYDVETEGDTAFIRPVAAEDVLRKMLACLSNEEFGDMSLADVEEALSGSPADKVAIGWPQGRKSCVCRILAVAQGPDCTVLLFPGPPDIEKVNEEIAEYRRTHGCPAPERDCETCPALAGGCKILADAGEEAEKRRREDNGQKDRP